MKITAVPKARRMEETMNKEELREGLKRLDVYASGQGLKSLFLEEGKQAEMDTLLLGLEMGEELSVDISCNLVHAPEFGNVLQYYGQLELNPIMEENPEAFSELKVFQMVNALNKDLPVGQLLYMQDEAEGQTRHLIGIRYTMLTELDDEAELEKCVSIIQMLMNIYEVLCSTLLLLMEGESLGSAMDIMANIMEE